MKSRKIKSIAKESNMYKINIIILKVFKKKLKIRKAGCWGHPAFPVQNLKGGKKER
ncbi:MAG: hypothetical protein LUE11_06445 [Clostridia bacterium]|nr:hypothetical protein [Clostridia bacterium]